MNNLRDAGLFSSVQTFICESKADYDRLIALNNKPLPEYLRRNRGRWNNGLNNRNGERMAPENLIRMNLAYQEVTDKTVNPPRPQPVSVVSYPFTSHLLDLQSDNGDN